MVILVVFAFDFQSIMTQENTFFLPENFAIGNCPPLDGDIEFDKLNFDHIYHDGPTNDMNQETIHRARMAEAVISDRLPLGNLKVVVCRSVHEERMLQYRLRDMGDRLPRITIEKRGGIFQRRGIYLEEIYLKDGTIRMKFNAPIESPQQSYHVKIHSGPKSWAGHLKHGSWIFNTLVAEDPDEVWTIEIEECVAYQAPVPLQTDNLI